MKPLLWVRLLAASCGEMAAPRDQSLRMGSRKAIAKPQ